MIEPRSKQPWRSLRDRLRPDPAVPARVWMRRHWLSLAALALSVFGILTGDTWLYSCGFDGCPTTAQIRAYRPPEGSPVLDRSGRLLGRLSYIRRVNVPLSHVPLVVRQAFIATEDRRFYRHNGLDWHAFFRAAIRDASSLGVREGFSTITMQVARNSFTPDLLGERSIRRKLLELRLARLIERDLTKNEILELYLNVIYLGDGTYGVEAASRDLFGKSVSKVTLPEAAMLAALPKGPSTYTPRHDPERARARRDLVLELMAREGYISEARARAAARDPIVVAESEWRPRVQTSAAIDVVRAFVDSVLGPDAADAGDLTVYTSIDATAQRAAERAVRNEAAAIDRETATADAEPAEQVQGALVALDPRTGDVRAWVGGRRPDAGGFDRVRAAHRQPGSAFKPFVYAAALAKGYTPATLVDDVPVEIPLGDRTWTPANFDDEYAGRITMRQAIAKSSNVAAVRFGRDVGEDDVVRVAHDAGIASALAPVPSIALGALDVTPLELVTAYATFANGGLRVTPRLVRRIESADGSVLWSSEPVRPEPALDPRDAFQLTSMLESVVDDGTGRAVRAYGARGPIAGKTGTTSNNTDVWFVGYTPSIVAGVWFGYDTPRSLGDEATGGRYAAPAWAEFYINGWPEGARDAPWRPPPGLIARVIDADNGELATEYCPVRRTEWFKPGTEPTEYCHDHEGSWLGARIVGALKRILRF